MPLSELYRLAKGKLDSTQDKNATCSNDLSSRPENEFVELVWENGQVLMQGQSSRMRKAPTGNSLQTHSPKPRDYVGNGSNTKYGKFGVMDCALNEFHIPGPSGEMGLNQDNDLVPWLSYPIDKSLQNGYCSDFITELSSVTVNEASAQNQLSSIGKRYGDNNPSIRSNPVSVQNGVSSEQGNVSKVSWLYPSSHGSKVSDCDNMSDSTHLAVSQDSPTVPTIAGGFSGMRPQKPDPAPPGRNSVLVNFSHFSRPAALVKTNLQSSGVRPGSGLSERTGGKDKVSTSYSNIAESKLFHSSNGVPKETSPSRQSTAVLQKANSRPSHDIPVEEPVKQSAVKEDKNANQIAESSIKGLLDVEKAIEPAVACSSVCSGNSIERPSDDATHNSKRKSRDTDSECPSEDVEEESMDVKRAAHARAGTSSKRSRAAEVHNLSERRRRDRINEKMRSLQELIPNCNKVDKASMLDEAIEYLKTLQLQVQIMSMGAGLYMPQMMMPPHLHAAHMGHFSPMVGMGVGMGMHYGMGLPDMNGGSSGFPMPPMQGAHFPCPPIPPTSAVPMHGIAGSNLQVHGLPSQGLPMPIPRAPPIPLSGGPPLKSAVEQNPVPSSKDLMQNTSAKSSVNQTPTQCQATNKDFDQSALAQNNGQAANAKAGEAVNNAD